MADSDASIARRATLSTLPLELKVRICELAALQDERYKERWIPGAQGEELIEVHKNEWRGRSLAALSESSKEFNELAAKHIFHTLTDVQIDSLEFSLTILARHISRVRRVIIMRQAAGAVARAATNRVFVALPLLPSLIDIQINQVAAVQALGPLVEENEPFGSFRMIRNAFRPVARRLHTVALLDFKWAESAVEFLKMCPILRDITVTGNAVADPLKSGSLGEYLSTMTTLESLTLDATSVGSQGLHFASGWPTLATLSSLDLINIELDANSVALINQHAPTLRHLTLRLPDDSPPTPPTGFPPHPFPFLPKLSSFTLRNVSSDTFESVAAAIAYATRVEAQPARSTLQELNVELKDYGTSLILTQIRLRSVLQPFANLHFLNMAGPGGTRLANHLLPIFPPNESRPSLLSARAEKDAFLSRSPAKSVKAKVRAAPDAQRHRVVARHQAITAALAHGERLADRFLREDDVDGLEIMFECLGGIWGDKLLEDD